MRLVPLLLLAIGCAPPIGRTDHAQSMAFTIETPAGARNLFDVWGHAAGDVFVAATMFSNNFLPPGALLHSTGDGQWAARWQDANSNPGRLGGVGSTILFTGQGDIYAVDYTPPIYCTSTDDGFTFQCEGNEDAAIAVSDGAGGVYFDGYAIVHNSESVLQIDAYGLAFAGGTLLAAGVFSDGVAAALRSTDRGETYAAIDLGAAGTLRAVWTDGALALAVGTGGLLARSIDGGATWSTTTLGSSDWTALWTDGVTAYAVGAGGAMAATADGGRSWSAIASGTTSDLRAVWSVTGGDVYAVTSTQVVHGHL